MSRALSGQLPWAAATCCLCSTQCPLPNSTPPLLMGGSACWPCKSWGTALPSPTQPPRKQEWDTLSIVGLCSWYSVIQRSRVSWILVLSFALCPPAPTPSLHPMGLWQPLRTGIFLDQVTRVSSRRLGLVPKGDASCSIYSRAHMPLGARASPSTPRLYPNAVREEPRVSLLPHQHQTKTPPNTGECAEQKHH